MTFLSTYEGTRRNRRRRAWRRGVWWLALVALVAAVGSAAYRLGTSQGRTEAARLEQDLASLREAGRLMAERTARAEQQAEAATARAAQLQRQLETELPRGVLKELGDRLAERLRQGVPPERLAFLLDQAAIVRPCARDPERQRLTVHTTQATVPAGSAAFAEGRILVSAEGAASAAPTMTGDPPGFDAARPIVVRFLAIDGDVGTVRGVLPLTYALAQGKEEFQFAIRASDRPDQIDITSQRCPLP